MHDDVYMKILQCQYLNLIIQGLHMYKQIEIHTLVYVLLNKSDI